MRFYIASELRDGKLYYNSVQMKSILANFKDGSSISIVLESEATEKSKEQLGYFFAGIIQEVAAQWGWEEDEVYKWIISNCNKQAVVDKFTGEITFCAFGLSHCGKKEMSEVIDRAIRLLAEHGFVVPEPLKYRQRNKADTRTKLQLELQF